ncbi:MAG: flagellar protein FlgN [Verrucomicrobia bacterium]|nr:flagellar protein FlgN [Verrucomicrobiota bacterium]
MNHEFDEFIEALRQELQHYGELLALINQQQEHLMRRDADAVLTSVGRIHAQGACVQAARARRAECLLNLALSLSIPPDGLVGTLLPVLPPQRRPQVQALVDENNRLLMKIQQRGRQNHLLLAHSIEHMSRLIQTLTGVGRGMVYDEGGGVLAPGARQGLYEAVG